jgi:hypothetical protein
MMNTSLLTALCLKLFGVILIFSSLLDFLIMAIPLNLKDTDWQLGLIGGAVERGVVPLLGISLILVGYWADSILNAEQNSPKSAFDLRLPTYIFAAVLGLFFLLVIPVYLGSLNEAKGDTMTKIERGASESREQVQRFLAQVDQYSKNPALLDEQINQRKKVLEAGQVQGNPLNPQQINFLTNEVNQLEGLRKISKDPAVYRQKIEQIKGELEAEMEKRLQKAESEATTQALKRGLKTGLSSLMFAIGFTTVGALGLRNVMSGADKR